jgi:rhodanese-related sulfurtransferase
VGTTASSTVVRVDVDGLQQLIASGATVIDVLPEETYADEHLPGAVNIPLTSLDDDAVADLDPSRPVVVYCFDHQCDLSPRAAARLVALGFTDVYDFVAGRAAWTSAGLPTEGAVGDRDRIGPFVHCEVPRCALQSTVGDVRSVIGDWELCVVVDDDDVVLGEVRADALGQPADLPISAVLLSGPGTVRLDARVRDLAAQLDRDHLARILVTTFDGRLMGLLRREDLDAVA